MVILFELFRNGLNRQDFNRISHLFERTFLIETSFDEFGSDSSSLLAGKKWEMAAITTAVGTTDEALQFANAFRQDKVSQFKYVLIKYVEKLTF